MQIQDKIHQRLSYLMHTPEERDLKKQNLNKENKNKILSLKNKYKGERCFIVGTSPSINSLDLTKLSNEHTFTVNRGYLLKEQGLIHSDFHILVDKRAFLDTASNPHLLEGFSSMFFCYCANKSDINIDTCYIDLLNPKLSSKFFEEDMLKPLIDPYSVIFSAIQIAYYLGFKDIYLIGVDLDFNKNKGHAYKETKGEKERQITISTPEASIVLDYLDKYTKYLNERNVNIYNASPVGIVECMPRVKYEELF